MAALFSARGHPVVVSENRSLNSNVVCGGLFFSPNSDKSSDAPSAILDFWFGNNKPNGRACGKSSRRGSESLVLLPRSVGKWLNGDPRIQPVEIAMVIPVEAEAVSRRKNGRRVDDGTNGRLVA